MTQNPTIDVARQKPIWKSVAIGLALGAFTAFGVEIGRMATLGNKHTVLPGRVYRSAQLKPDDLRPYVQANGIKTIVNLRGRSFDASYPVECSATQSIGISQEDITTSANRLPAPGELHRLIEVFDRAEHPLLLHCRQGADRTGLAAAMYLLLYTDAPYEVARQQCTPRYGHFAFHTTAAMDEFFGSYESWLERHTARHSSEGFRHWVLNEYSPSIGSCVLELIDGPTVAKYDSPTKFTVRAYNTSRETWEFKAGTGVGVHAVYLIYGPSGTPVYGDRAGLMDATVRPGEHIDFKMSVPALAAPGKYRLQVDLSKRMIDFVKYGTEPLFHDWDASNTIR